MISDEAVEAAAKVLFATHPVSKGAFPWDSHPEGHIKQNFRADASLALEAAAQHMLQGDVEWAVFRASDGPNGSPAENLRYSTKAGAQESIDTRYGTPELWEPRRRTVGEWAK